MRGTLCFEIEEFVRIHDGRRSIMGRVVAVGGGGLLNDSGGWLKLWVADTK